MKYSQPHQDDLPNFTIPSTSVTIRKKPRTPWSSLIYQIVIHNVLVNLLT